LAFLQIWFVGFLCVVIPYASIKSALHLKAGAIEMPAPKKLHSSNLMIQLGMLALAILALREGQYQLVGRYRPTLLHVVAGAAMLAIVLGSAPFRFRLATDARRQRVLTLLPRKPADVPLYAVLCLAAGTIEEFVYRGALFVVLRPLLGGVGAVAICALAFGFAHSLQGPRAAAVIGLYAVVAHALVWYTGTLFIAMAVHFIYDLSVGFLFPKMAADMNRTRVAVVNA
jgi:membrane protease YdiL (CAAX protease family)